MAVSFLKYSFRQHPPVTLQFLKDEFDAQNVIGDGEGEERKGNVEPTTPLGHLI